MDPSFFFLKLRSTKLLDVSSFETSFSSSLKPQLPFPFGCLLGNGAKGFNDNLSDNGLQTGRLRLMIAIPFLSVLFLFF